MKEFFENCYKIAFNTFVTHYNRQPNEDEEKALREMVCATTAMFAMAEE